MVMHPCGLIFLNPQCAIGALNRQNAASQHANGSFPGDRAWQGLVRGKISKCANVKLLPRFLRERLLAGWQPEPDR